jgi:hypothetical protein
MGRLAAAKLLPTKAREETDNGAVSRVMLHLVVRESSQPPG